MNYTRRHLALLLPAMAAAQDTKAPEAKLLSKVYRFEDLPVKTNGKNRSRAVLNGQTHTGFPVEMHETELAPGEAPHPPHHHTHEELMMVREGILEVTISGHTSKAGPGSVVYVASNEEHGWRNAGDGTVHYFVMTLGRA